MHVAVNSANAQNVRPAKGYREIHCVSTKRNFVARDLHVLREPWTQMAKAAVEGIELAAR